jgi:uncharacterized membrane protein YsdA (DUF1294 family)
VLNNMLTNAATPGAPEFMLVCSIGYMMFACGLTYALFGIDKQRAVLGDQRIPEVSLLTLAALGGWPGAKLAQARFHHKTRAQPFGTILNLIAAGQVVVLVAQMIPVATAAEWAGTVRASALEQFAANDLGN